MFVKSSIKEGSPEKYWIYKKNCAKEIKKICVQNNLGPTKTFGSEQTLKSQKHLGLKKIWVQNNLGEEKKMVHENIWV